ncbi:MAG TPA: HTTM domain-containing protein [Polyangiaceae bacterium]|jgi:hypothetical protein
MMLALRRWRDETGDVTLLGAVRVVLGALLLANALRAASELRAGYFGDVFHWPILPSGLVPSRGVYTAIVVVQLVVAVLVVVGLRARDALLASALLGTYVLLCDRLQYHHNRWALFAYALLLAFAPCDRTFCVTAARVGRIGPLWAARLAQLQVSVIYVASGGSKLFDPDWRSGRVLLERFHLYARGIDPSGVVAALVQLVAHPATAGLLAAFAIATELFLAAGLWWRKTRVLALCWGVGFHLSIEATSRVEGFTWLTLAVYALFLTPDMFAWRVLAARADAFTRRAKRL